MRTLHWICDAPSPYNSYLFRTLAASPGIDLCVHFRRLGVASHPWTRSLLDGFESREIAPGLLVDPRLMRVAMESRTSALVVGGWNDLTLQALLSFSSAPFAIWTDTRDVTAERGALKRTLRSGWLRYVLPRAERVFGTGTQALAVLGAMGAPQRRLENFPYWIDLTQFGPIPAHDTTAPLVIISSGRLAAEKGYDIALRALAAAVGTGGTSFLWRVAGTGVEEMALRSLATELGIADRVEWLGWTDPRELPALYRSADLFLHPARWEPYGVVVLEAMASGLPVLASKQTNAALDRVVDGTSGLLHDVGDTARLASQLRWSATHRAALRTMGGAAYTTAREWPIERAVHIISDFMTSLG